MRSHSRLPLKPQISTVIWVTPKVILKRIVNQESLMLWWVYEVCDSSGDLDTEHL